MRFRVVFTPRARADAVNAFRWIAERSPEAAARWYAGLEKAIANTIALCLAGQFAQIDSHSRLPRECLLFRNETRSLEVLAGQRNLEPKCRQQLKQKIPEDLPAIEALLNAFPSAQTATDKGRGRAHPAVRPPKKSSRTTKQRQ